jgi:rRNA pseudouridine-1189 N-methylase Emg1 (Nep1/Mra1 family)
MPRFLRRVIGAMGALLHRDRVDRDLDEELKGYLDAAIERHVQTGLSREAATRAARVEIGSTTALRQGVRDAG